MAQNREGRGQGQQRDSGFKDKVIFINRVAKVVKGGKRFSFSALVTVGDGKGMVGIGKGKAAEVPDAIRKAVEQAKKYMIKVELKGNTIPFAVTGRFGSEEVLLKPAMDGSGIIAGGAARSILEVLGVKNVICKTLGRGNPYNASEATLDGLKRLKLSHGAAEEPKTVEETKATVTIP
jgi:small subunit ribosomal protein S5